MNQVKKQPFAQSYATMNRKTVRTIHYTGTETLAQRLQRQRIEDMGCDPSVIEDRAEFFSNVLDESHLLNKLLDFPGFDQ